MLSILRALGHKPSYRNEPFVVALGVPRAGETQVRIDRVRRRDFVTALGAAAVAWPFVVRAEQRAMPVIGFLAGPAAGGWAPQMTAFRQGLNEAGYVEGRNVGIELRSAEGQFDRLPALAAELVRRRVAVIVAFTTPAGLAAKAATSTIPIVLLTGDPVGTGLVASLPRPGGNITGMSYMIPETHGKCVELLRDMLPSVRRVAALGNASDPSNKQIVEQIKLAGQTIGLEIAPVQLVAGVDGLDDAFATMEKEQAGAVVVQASLPVKRVSEIALKYRLPLATSFRAFVESGGLISYSAVEADLWRRSAIFVHKILQGSRPADLPVEQPTKFELLLNLKTAKALGIEVPPMLLARADGIVE
jgi:putative ABC transport system substrate-binding protein